MYYPFVSLHKDVNSDENQMLNIENKNVFNTKIIFLNFTNLSRILPNLKTHSISYQHIINSH